MKKGGGRGYISIGDDEDDELYEEARMIALVAGKISTSFLQRKLRIGYRDTDGNETTRVVWPVLLGYRDTGRILAAWCELRQAFRYFRTDKMVSAEMLSDAIPERSRALRMRWEVAMAAERATYAAQEPTNPDGPIP